MNWPPNPTQLNDLLIKAVCEDGLRRGGPNVARVLEIHRQMKSTPEERPGPRLETDSGPGEMKCPEE